MPSAAIPGTGLTMVRAPKKTSTNAFSYPNQSLLFVLKVRYPAVKPLKRSIHPKNIADVTDMNIGKNIPTSPKRMKMIPTIFEFFENFCKKSNSIFFKSFICNIFCPFTNLFTEV